MSVKALTSSVDLDEAVKSGTTVIWIFDSDGANRSFGKKYDEVASNITDANFYKAGDQDVKEAIKSHGLDVDWTFVFKDGKKVEDHREDHNAVDLMVKRYL